MFFEILDCSNIYRCDTYNPSTSAARRGVPGRNPFSYPQLLAYIFKRLRFRTHRADDLHHDLPIIVAACSFWIGFAYWTCAAFADPAITTFAEFRGVGAAGHGASRLILHAHPIFSRRRFSLLRY